MRFYNRQHRFYCGIDLHARTLSVCILDTDGTTVFHDTVGASPAAFLKAVQPFRDGLVVASECMFAWYWLADLCAHESAGKRQGPGGNKIGNAHLEWAFLRLVRGVRSRRPHRPSRRRGGRCGRCGRRERTPDRAGGLAA